MISNRTALAALTVLAASAPARAEITISAAATQNMSCSGGICVPTATKATLNATDLENDLSQFGNVQVLTTGNGVEANDIVVVATISSPDSTSLTLDAHKVITVNAAISIGAGTAELELQSDKGGKLGTLSFGPNGHITFGSLSDIFGINGGIFTLEDSVQGLASAVAAKPSGAFALANSYDASQDGTYTSSPVATTLKGTVEGLGNTISRLAIKSRDRDGVALFSEIGTTGSVSDVRLSQAHILDRQSGGGILVEQNFGLLFEDSVAGTIEGRRVAAGIAAVNQRGGTIASSVSNATVTILGSNNLDDSGGGIAGQNAGTIVGSYATGAVTDAGVDDGPLVGGVAGFNYGTIDSSFATGAVSVSGYQAAVGGLVGDDQGTTSNCYASGSVTGGSGNFGGLIGFATNGTLSSSYSTGTVTGDSGSFLGGLVGYVDTSYTSYSISDAYWDTDTSGITDLSQGAGNMANYPGITGLGTQQLQAGLPAGFDPKIWAEKSTVNNGLPYLIANPPPK